MTTSPPEAPPGTPDPSQHDAMGVPDPEAVPTLRLPVVAKMLGISKGAAYAAAARGDIPSIKIGRTIVVPTAEFRRMLLLDPELAAS